MVVCVIQNENGTKTRVSMCAQKTNTTRVQRRLCLEYLKDCTCTNSFADDLVATCDEILDTAETTSVNPIDKTNY